MVLSEQSVCTFNHQAISLALFKMLFYNIRLHCYVVIEIKTEKFKPSDIGQVGTYVVAVNHILKTEQENPTIGLIICKERDEVLA